MDGSLYQRASIDGKRRERETDRQIESGVVERYREAEEMQELDGEKERMKGGEGFVRKAGYPCPLTVGTPV